jgi:hypothetical protein
MPTRNINSDLKVNANLTLPSLSTYSGSDVTALMIAGADVVGKRALGTNAFNSTSFLPLAGGTMTGSLTIDGQGSSSDVLKLKGSARIQVENASGNDSFYISNTGGSGASKLDLGGAVSIIEGGNVGIGTTSPSYRLHVAGTLGLTSSQYFTNNTAYIQTGSSWGNGVLNFLNGATTAITFDVPNNRIKNNLGKYLTASSGTGQFGTLDNQSVAIVANNSTKMTLLSGGNVGIGTTSPSYPLEVANTATVSIAYQRTGVSAKKWGFHSDNANTYWQNLTDNVLALTVSNAGNVGIGTLSPTSILHVESSTPTVTIKSTGSASSKVDLVGTYTTWSLENQHVNGATNDMFRIYNSQLGSNALTIHRLNNNVGIGTTSPTAKLDIVGDGADFFLQSADYKIARIQPRGTGANLDKGLLSLFDGSTEDVRIDTAGNSWFNGGNVGIGQGSPTAKLHLKGDGGSSGLTFKTTDASNNETFFIFDGGRAGVRYHPFSIGIPSTTSVAGNAVFQVEEAGLLTVLSTGKVGVGTTNPTAKFEVTDGSSSITLQEYSSGAAIFLDGVNGDFTGGDYFHILANNNYYLGLGGYGGGTTPLNISNAGKVGIGTTSPDKKLDVEGSIRARNAAGSSAAEIDVASGSTWRLRSNPTSGTNSYGLDVIKGSAGTDVKLSINSSGNVGIGTTSPTEKLHVEGNIELINGGYIGSLDGSYWQRIRFEDATPSTTNALNFETRNGSGSFIKHMVIRNDGNVGVGNATPATKLAVEGTIAHKVYTVSTLPSASPAGQRAFVSDSSYSLTQAHGLVTVGSGSNFCPMYSDGTNWRVG